MDRVTGDLILRGKQRAFAGDLRVDGLVDVSQGGVLRCAGTLRCLAMVVEGRSTVTCRELVTNVLEVDNSDGWAGQGEQLIAERVHARIIKTVQLGLDRLLARGVVTCEYLTHFGGDLNPSFDHERGTRKLLGAAYRESCGRHSILINYSRLCGALRCGENPFTVGEPLVTAPPRPPPPPADDDPLLLELSAWLAAHPGPQRATLADLAAWLPRLTPAPASTRIAARKQIINSITSPKLTAARDALLVALADH
jgi:hypothetical protein